jgi:hypothetical protein
VTLKTLFLDLNEAFREITTLEFDKGIHPAGLLTFACLDFSDSWKVWRNPGSLCPQKTSSIDLGRPRYCTSLYLSKLLAFAQH